MLAPSFDLISVPTHGMRGIFSATLDVSIDLHGLQKELFDVPSPTPYTVNSGVNVVFAGNSHFDYDFVARARRRGPPANFHIIGQFPICQRSPCDCLWRDAVCRNHPLHPACERRAADPVLQSRR